MTNGVTFVLNFGHPLGAPVLALLGPAKEVRVPASIVLKRETASQVVEIVEFAIKKLGEVGGALDGTVPLVVNLPQLAELAAVLLAEIHGRLGEFPRILALRRQVDGTYNLFANSAGLGVVDLQRVRREARGQRNGPGGGVTPQPEVPA